MPSVVLSTGELEQLPWSILRSLKLEDPPRKSNLSRNEGDQNSKTLPQVGAVGGKALSKAFVSRISMLMVSRQVLGARRKKARRSDADTTVVFRGSTARKDRGLVAIASVRSQ